MRENAEALGVTKEEASELSMACFGDFGEEDGKQEGEKPDGAKPAAAEYAQQGEAPVPKPSQE